MITFISPLSFASATSSPRSARLTPSPTATPFAETFNFLANRQNVQALKDIAEALYNTKADDLVIDRIAKKLKVSANGVAVGEGVNLADLGDEVAEANDNGLIKVII